VPGTSCFTVFERRRTYLTPRDATASARNKQFKPAVCATSAG
jgi:hypothetical protein